MGKNKIRLHQELNNANPNTRKTMKKSPKGRHPLQEQHQYGIAPGGDGVPWLKAAEIAKYAIAFME
jgi:hypothetical protein